MTQFRAPWSKSLIVASTFATLVCLGVSYALWTLPMDASLERLRFWLALLPLAIILVCALFTVRGYSIANNDLLIDGPSGRHASRSVNSSPSNSIPLLHIGASALSATVVFSLSPATFATEIWALTAPS